MQEIGAAKVRQTRIVFVYRLTLGGKDFNPETHVSSLS
jgi:hypothetical protein